MASKAPAHEAASRLPTRPITRERVRMSVGDYIKEQIFEGKIRVGERIPQDEVARVLGVSNTPVREAVIALESEGILEIRPHRGAFVCHVDRDRIRDNYELFSLLYGWALKRAVAGTSARNKHELVAIAGRLAGEKDLEAIRPLMVEFVDVLGRMCASPAWRHLVDAVPDLLPADAYYTAVPGMADAVAPWMRLIAEAVDQGDGEAAASAAERMLQQHGAALVAELERRGLFDAS
ncbi:GntR family transcriptional regulator [Frankia sp. AiPs1]|uniref:GntR family transcriptional regulator n=1 Tax=Frankia sp. AiPs1 TaxID=573493 RepID=UPI002044BEB1|nr:GntR family transcriptional regulator [Frankia sp. AiPs1]MCM3921892.1 GntR family transcriptional regulator [Frankia sp. AiPs1]